MKASSARRIEPLSGTRSNPALNLACFFIPLVMFLGDALVCVAFMEWTRPGIEVQLGVWFDCFVLLQAVAGCWAGVIARRLKVDNRRYHAAVYFAWGSAALFMLLACTRGY